MEELIPVSIMNSVRVTIYTDGSCVETSGGWAYIIHSDDGRYYAENSGHVSDTTSNRMEMIAAIKALQRLKTACAVKLYTDSEYLRTGITEWVPRWRENNWRRTNGSVKNKDLWIILDEFSIFYSVEYIWVKSHSGDLNNDRVDELAGRAARGNPLDENITYDKIMLSEITMLIDELRYLNPAAYTELLRSLEIDK